MKKALLILLLLFAATTAVAMDTTKKITLFWGGSTDTVSYVYFGTDRVVFGTDPITI